jgi:protein-S-isoprenylcysteine O-methyltransferase Ste14
LKGADKMKSKFLPPTYFWLLILVSVLLHFILPIKKIITSPYRYFGILGSLITLIFPVLFIIISELLFIPFEEENLEKLFGKKYSEYKKKKRRWI